MCMQPQRMKGGFGYGSRGIAVRGAVSLAKVGSRLSCIGSAWGGRRGTARQCRAGQGGVSLVLHWLGLQRLCRAGQGWDRLDMAVMSSRRKLCLGEGCAGAAPPLYTREDRRRWQRRRN